MKKHYSKSNQPLKDKLYNYEEQPLADSWNKLSAGLEIQEAKVKHATKIRKTWQYSAVTVALIGITVWVLMLSNSKVNTVLKVEYPSTDSVRLKDNVNVKEVPKVLPSKAPIVIVPSEIKKVTQKTGDKKETFTLPDGSTVTLNQYSEISYDIKLKDRTVTVNGEAFFHVKSNKAEPLIIYGNISKMKGSGTSFEVRSYKNETYDEVNVKKGSVSVERLNGKSEILVIFGGYKATISDTELFKEGITDENFDAWQTEKIVFHDTGLKEVFSTLENYYHISIATNSPEILNCRFTGVFEKSEINEVLQVLSVSFDLSYNENSKNYTLSGKGCK